MFREEEEIVDDCSSENIIIYAGSFAPVEFDEAVVTLYTIAFVLCSSNVLHFLQASKI